jgi:hypothetical protein
MLRNLKREKEIVFFSLILTKLLLKSGDKSVGERERRNKKKKRKRKVVIRRSRRSFETEKLVRHAHIHPIESQSL